MKTIHTNNNGLFTIKETPNGIFVEGFGGDDNEMCIRFMWKLSKVFLLVVDMKRMEKTITLHITSVYAREST